MLFTTHATAYFCLHGRQNWYCCYRQKILTKMSWLRIEPWTWTHSITQATFSLHPNNNSFINARLRLNHLLREGFRADSYQGWSVSTRIDAQACQNIEYSESRCQLARRCEQDAQHRFAILSGGFVSEAKLSVIRGATLARCSCGQIHTFDHMIWYCRDVPDHSMRPPVPTDWLHRRLAWPSGRPPMMKPPSLGWFMSVSGHLYSEV